MAVLKLSRRTVYIRQYKLYGRPSKAALEKATYTCITVMY